jgi:hypothetical protein
VTGAEIDAAFTYHKPEGNQTERYQDVRAECKALAESIQELCPDSREKSLALTKLRETMMWANSAIAING